MNAPYMFTEMTFFRTKFMPRLQLYASRAEEYS
jgi:hypothetical protein